MIYVLGFIYALLLTINPLRFTVYKTHLRQNPIYDLVEVKNNLLSHQPNQYKRTKIIPWPKR